MVRGLPPFLKYKRMVMFNNWLQSATALRTRKAPFSVASKLSGHRPDKI